MFFQKNKAHNKSCEPKQKAMDNISYPSPYDLPFPSQYDFYNISTEEYSGLIPIHSVRMSFVLPYDDWCEYEKSNLHQHLLSYLEELQKRDNLHVRKALED